jgi:AAHS family 4-hydroxybenzoate transporter-like MFS transporter
MSTERHTGGTTALHALLEAQSLKPYHFVVFGLCFLGLMLDGFCAQTMGYVAPVLKEQWHISPEKLGQVFSASIFGMLVGSLTLSVIADKFGRRPVMVGALLWAGVLVTYTTTARNLEQLVVLRFLTGLGLGTLMPTMLSLISEYAPVKSRSTIVTIACTGFVLGAAVGGGIASVLIPHYGPYSVFLFSGVATVAIAILLQLCAPESIQYLASKKVIPVQQIGTILQRFGIAADRAKELATGTQNAKKPASWKNIFSGRQGWVTILLWVVNFTNLLDLYFLANWLPTLLKSYGLALAVAIAGSTALQSGGLPGSIGLGLLIRRFKIEYVLVFNFLLATIAIASVGYAVGTTFLHPAIFIAGVCIIGGQSAVNALSAHCYPPQIRSTGMGWAMGIGRLGSILGPIIGGTMVANNHGPQDIMFMAAFAAFVSFLAVTLMTRVAR